MLLFAISSRYKKSLVFSWKKCHRLATSTTISDTTPYGSQLARYAIRWPRIAGLHLHGWYCCLYLLLMRVGLTGNLGSLFVQLHWYIHPGSTELRLHRHIYIYSIVKMIQDGWRYGLLFYGKHISTYNIVCMINTDLYSAYLKQYIVSSLSV